MKLKKLEEIVMIELKRNLHKTNVLFLLIFFISSILIFQIASIRFKSEKMNKFQFLEAEKKQLEQIENYIQYGFEGIRMMVDQNPLLILTYNSTSFDELEAFFDIRVRLNISSPQIGGDVFKKAGGGNLDFSWFLIIISGFTSIWGFFTFREKEYLRFLQNFTNVKFIYLGIFLSKALIITATMLLIGVVFYFQFILNGINLIPSDIISSLGIFILVAIIILLFFWVVGAILGALQNPINGVMLTVLIWFILSFLIPEILNVIFSNNSKADIRSRNQHQIQKTEIAAKFNNLFRNKLKEVKTRGEMIELNKIMTEQYLNTNFKEIERLESDMIDDILKNAEKYHFRSNFSPVTFYKSVNNELSGNGYNEYLKFYKLNNEKRREFVKLCLVNRMNVQKTQFEPFLKSDNEYIYHAKSSLPKYFGLGIIINCIYLIGALFIGFFRFKRVLYPLPDRAGAFDDLEFKFKKGKFYKYDYRTEDVPNQLYNALKGQAEKFQAKITIDGEDIVTGKKPDIFYLPSPDSLPGEIKAGSLLTLVAGALSLPKLEIKKLKEESGDIISKRLAVLEPLEKIELLVKLAKLKGAKIVIFDNFFGNIAEYDINRICKDLKSDEQIIVELTPVYHVKHANFDHYAIIHPVGTKYRESIGKKG